MWRAHSDGTRVSASPGHLSTFPAALTRSSRGCPARASCCGETRSGGGRRRGLRRSSSKQEQTSQDIGGLDLEERVPGRLHHDIRPVSSPDRLFVARHRQSRGARHDDAPARCSTSKSLRTSRPLFARGSPSSSTGRAWFTIWSDPLDPAVQVDDDFLAANSQRSYTRDGQHFDSPDSAEAAAPARVGRA